MQIAAGESNKTERNWEFFFPQFKKKKEKKDGTGCTALLT